MGLANDKFPSSTAFDTIASAFEANPDERKDAIRQGNAVFAFTLKNKAGETESWYVDLKNSGTVGTGTGGKPTVTLSLSDENFGKLFHGQASSQRLFLTGKLRIRGDILKTNKLEPILNKLKSSGKAKL